jgi:hypothetical protein
LIKNRKISKKFACGGLFNKGLSRNELSIFWPFSDPPTPYLSNASAF